MPIWLESSLQVKKAGGLQRGKTDSIDAQRIASMRFAFTISFGYGSIPVKLFKS